MQTFQINVLNLHIFGVNVCSDLFVWCVSADAYVVAEYVYFEYYVVTK